MSTFGSLALMVTAGLVGPVLASPRRFGLPVVFGEIAAGVAIGTSGLRWVDPSDPLLTGLAAIGFALLMFIVGTHVPVRDRRLRSALGSGAAVAGTVGLLAVGAAVLVSSSVGLDRPAILAVILATSSGAVALPVLQELDERDRAALVTTVWIAVADVATVLALPLVLATGSIVRVLTGGLLVVLAAAFMFVAAKAARSSAPVCRLREMSHKREWGLDLRISLLALFACAWLANRFGTSILIAGFAVGLVVALLGEPQRVAQQLVGIGEGFAIPLYFVYLGTQIDLGALFASPRALILGATLSGLAVAIHIIAGAVWRLPLPMGLMASAQLGVPASVVSIGLATNQLTAAQGTAVMASLLVTLAICALGAAVFGQREPVTGAGAPVVEL